MHNRTKLGFITLPAAIIIAAAILAIAIIWVSRPAGNSALTNTNTTANSIAKGPAINMRAITNTDHILGNPSAPIKLVEYSDPSCPFCKMFAPTIEKVMTNYGASGTVAWVYRSYPLDKPDGNGYILHVNAGHESQAIECAGLLGGNDKYWIFLKRLYEVTPAVTQQTPKGLDQSQLPVIAKFAGLDVKAFNTCLDSGQTKDKVEADYLDGVNAGVNGTPYNIFVLASPASSAVDQVITALTLQMGLQNGQLFISNDRKKIAMSGAMPYEAVKAVIDAILVK